MERGLTQFISGVAAHRGAAFGPVLYLLDGDVRADSPLHQTFYQSKLCS
jgi:hypothetical protein